MIETIPRPKTTTRSTGLVVTAVCILIGAGILAFWGITTRARALAIVTSESRDLATPPVRVVRPTAGAPQEEIVLPGTMQAFSEASVNARTNGYLKHWYVELGTRVRAGQLLAEIDTPELDQQIQQARADLGASEANARLAQTTAERYRDLISTDSVSRQDLENANGNLDARQSGVESARANVKRLEQLQAFRRIEAPFDGVITARNTEVGALIDPGGSAKELFHIAATQKLRVFVNVPQIYSRVADEGLAADLVLKEFPGRRFAGRLVRTAESIEAASRTLLVEIDVDNPKGELLPGSYAEVHLKLPTPASTFRLPVNAVMSRSEGLEVAIVKDGNRVELKDVTVGRDYGNEVEVLTGVSGEDQVIADPPDALSEGQTVRIAKAPAKEP